MPEQASSFWLYRFLGSSQIEYGSVIDLVKLTH
jgi:hypothetical protein